MALQSAKLKQRQSDAEPGGHFFSNAHARFAVTSFPEELAIRIFPCNPSNASHGIALLKENHVQEAQMVPTARIG
jgi:hypothetical protein